MFYLNPAGLSRVDSVYATISGSIYGVSNLSAGRFFNETPDFNVPGFGAGTLDRTDLSSTRFLGYSTNFGVMAGFGPPAGSSLHLAVGLSLTMPRASTTFYAGQTQATGNAYAKTSVSAANDSKEIDFGPTFAIQLGRRLHLGASLLFVYQPVDNSVKTDFVFTNDSGNIYSVIAGEGTSSGFSFDFAAVLGAQLEVTPELFLGLAVGTPSGHLGDSFSGHVIHRAFSNVSSQTAVIDTTLKGGVTRPLPFRVSLGAAYRKWRRGGAALDFTLLVPRSDGTALETDDTIATLRPGYAPETTTMHTRSVTRQELSFRLNAGGEVNLSPRWVARAGFFMTRPLEAAFTQPMIASDLLSERLAFYGGTLGVGNTVGSVETTYGLGFSYATGTVGGMTFLSEQVRETPLSGFQVLFFLAGGFSLGDLRRNL